MADRRRTQGVPAPRSPRGSLEENLRIDRDDLDGCLIEQPGHHYQVALALAEAVAVRDALKADFELLQANLDVKLRADFEERGEKTTEARLQQEMKLDPRYGEARKELLNAQAEVDRLSALKEAFQQRSFMLRELVALTVAERGDQAGAAGAYEARGRRVRAVEDARRERVHHPRRGGPGGYSGPEEDARG